MGLALAAELNGYPGPLHVLQLADQLALSRAQRAAIEAQVDDMKRAARVLGVDVIEAEAELNQLFASGEITTTHLEKITTLIGQKQGALRAAHLKYHLLTSAVLSSQQITHYKKLRGYAADHSGHATTPQ